MATQSRTFSDASSGASSSASSGANSGASEGARPATIPASGAWFGLLPVVSLWWREIVHFYRQKSRVVGVIASPVLFWIVLGSGFGSSIRSSAAAGGQNYLLYFFPGAL